MNREILFKAKHIDNGKWYYGSLIVTLSIVDDTISYYYIEDEFGDRFEVIPETICQYTGLKDKNGVKIFEGDIMKQHRMNGNENAGNLYKTIKWKNTFNYSGFNITKQGCKNWEVIGNIYDNKELLEKEDK